MAQARRLYAAGRLQEAGAQLDEVFRREPSNPDALQMLGAILFQIGKPVEGRRLVEQAVRVDPKNAPAWNSLGLIQHLTGENEGALKSFTRATEADPRFGEAWMNLGFTQQALGRLGEPVDAFERALAIGFRHPDVHFFLGNAYAALDRHEEAIAQYDLAIAMSPGHADAWNNRGNSLLAMGRGQEAAVSLDRATELMAGEIERIEMRRPGDPEAVSKRIDLIRNFQTQGKWRAALDRSADARDPGLRFLHALTMPVVFESSAMAEEALGHLREGIDRLREEGLHLEDPLRQVGLTAFHLPYFGVSERPIQEAIAKLYLEAAPSLNFTASHTPGRDRVRIGVLSAMLKKHSVSMIFGGLIERLDRDRFELVYLQVGAGDAVSQRMAERADRHLVLPANLSLARDQVAKEGLDLLFFPEVGADPLTYYLAFSRFAPVQCATWGHPLTTGSPTMDYFVSSRHLERDDGQVEYSEKLVRLPSLNAFYARPELPAEWSRSDLGLPADRRLYGCLQTAYKFHPDFDRVLAAILERDDRGCLVLVEPDRPHLKAMLLERWRRFHPVIGERALWLDRMALDRFLRVLQLCDAILAPTQFGAGRSALDSLAVGAPLVTYAGPYLKSRITYAAYKEIGFDELTATSEEQYVELALRLATDTEWQQAVRRQVAMKAGPLYANEHAAQELSGFFGSIAGSG